MLELRRLEAFYGPAQALFGVDLIVRAGHSPAKASQQAARLLADAGTPAAGAVINSVRQGSGNYYAYAYRTYGTYGAKGVYGSKDVYGEKAVPVDPSV